MFYQYGPRKKTGCLSLKICWHCSDAPRPLLLFCNTCWSSKHSKKCHRCYSGWLKPQWPDWELTNNCDCDSVVCLTGHDGPDTNAKLSCSSTVAYAPRPIRCHSSHPEWFRHTPHTDLNCGKQTEPKRSQLRILCKLSDPYMHLTPTLCHANKAKRRSICYHLRWKCKRESASEALLSPVSSRRDCHLSMVHDSQEVNKLRSEAASISYSTLMHSVAPFCLSTYLQPWTKISDRHTFLSELITSNMVQDTTPQNLTDNVWFYSICACDHNENTPIRKNS